MTAGYRADLAAIHEQGFGEFSSRALPGVVRELRAAGIRGGRIVELGCGPGRLAEMLARRGYATIGVDRSAAMIRRARARGPRLRWITGSLLRVALPRCDALLAVGEAINYAFDPAAGMPALWRLFRRARAALRPGGLLIFDLLEPASRPARRTFRAARNWAVLVDTRERGAVLTRDIVAFRRVGPRYRRSHEIHRLRLYPAARLAAALRRLGFAVRVRRGYSAEPLGRGHRVLIARRR